MVNAGWDNDEEKQVTVKKITVNIMKLSKINFFPLNRWFRYGQMERDGRMVLGSSADTVNRKVIAPGHNQIEYLAILVSSEGNMPFKIKRTTEIIKRASSTIRKTVNMNIKIIRNEDNSRKNADMLYLGRKFVQK